MKIRSWGSSVPSHTAARGVLHLRTTTGVVYIQTDDPTGTTWVAVGAGAGLADPGGNGIVVRTALNTTTNRSIAVSGDALSVSNADGVAGNPTLAAAADLENIVDTWAVDASGNVSGVGTIASGGHTITADKPHDIVGVNDGGASLRARQRLFVMDGKVLDSNTANVELCTLDTSTFYIAHVMATVQGAGGNATYWAVCYIDGSDTVVTVMTSAEQDAGGDFTFGFTLSSGVLTLDVGNTSGDVADIHVSATIVGPNA